MSEQSSPTSDQSPQDVNEAADELTMCSQIRSWFSKGHVYLIEKLRSQALQCELNRVQEKCQEAMANCWVCDQLSSSVLPPLLSFKEQILEAAASGLGIFQEDSSEAESTVSWDWDRLSSSILPPLLSFKDQVLEAAQSGLEIFQKDSSEADSTCDWDRLSWSILPPVLSFKDRILDAVDSAFKDVQKDSSGSDSGSESADK